MTPSETTTRYNSRHYAASNEYQHKHQLAKKCCRREGLRLADHHVILHHHLAKSITIGNQFILSNMLKRKLTCFFVREKRLVFVTREKSDNQNGVVIGCANLFWNVRYFGFLRRGPPQRFNILHYT
jgi:hypothetical protein